MVNKYFEKNSLSGSFLQKNLNFSETCNKCCIFYLFMTLKTRCFFALCKAQERAGSSLHHTHPLATNQSEKTGGNECEESEFSGGMDYFGGKEKTGKSPV